jgi:hypothetical protein
MPTSLPIRAATETAIRLGHTPDRCDILQNGHTLVLRLSETLVARIVTDRDGPRQGDAWFTRENAVAIHLATHGAPVIPLHRSLPPGPHQHLGYTLNFWQFVTTTDSPPTPAATGTTLFHCHRILRQFTDPLPPLAILHESRKLLENPDLFPQPTLDLLKRHLDSSLHALAPFPMQPLHGDAHEGNLLPTTRGLLWTDWEDTFLGPIEWDLASIIWNPLILQNHPTTSQQILQAYQSAGGTWHPTALHHALIARAAVMSAWYPILYPNPSQDRQHKLQFRLNWLSQQPTPT